MDEKLTLRQRFSGFARYCADLSGSPYAFAAAASLLVLWVLSGPFFGFSDTWQIYINTVTTIVTFLLVFLIQHSQNHDTRALQVKLDELIRATHGAHNLIMQSETRTEEELKVLSEHYAALAQKSQPQSENPATHLS